MLPTPTPLAVELARYPATMRSKCRSAIRASSQQAASSFATSKVLHALISVTPDTNLGAELLPAVAILPFMLYQLAGFGTLHYVVPKPVNWAINLAILALIVASYMANRDAAFGAERLFVGILVLSMAVTVFYGILRLKRMQATYDANLPPKHAKEKDDAQEA